MARRAYRVRARLVARKRRGVSHASLRESEGTKPSMQAHSEGRYVDRYVCFAQLCRQLTFGKGCEARAAPGV